MATKQLVLVTGINGYLGAHIVDQLVKAGYRVRGTVRSGKLDAACENNAIYGADVEVIAADDIAFGDFTEALKEQMGIRRFVLVSSLATVASIENTSPVWTDKDWVEVSREKALISRDPSEVYVTEKVLAERTVWEFADQHPHMNPPFFLGPYAPNFRFTDASLAQMSTNSLLYLLLNPSGPPFLPYLPSIDVRDVGRAAVHALTAPPASKVGAGVGRKRLLFLPHFVSWKDVVEHIAEARPELRDRLSRSARADFQDPPRRRRTRPRSTTRARSSY
ncbi:hypothetical protein C8Q73DRAFT_792476 [Cubamyces lactineus]|nr:hypothetical protein C8Q73DRAFT_792476 [Cubamyces lactineus]